MQNDTLLSPLKDARVRAVIEMLVEARRIPSSGSPSEHPEVSRDPFDYAEYGFSIWPDQGDLLYLLCRGMRATRVVDFATSIGMSAVYFAAAMREMAAVSSLVRSSFRKRLRLPGVIWPTLALPTMPTSGKETRGRR